MSQGRNEEINEYISGTKWKWKPYQNKNLWDTLKAVLWGKFIALFAYIKKKSRKSRNKWFNDTAENFGKTKQTKPQNTTWQEIIKIKTGINEIETKKTL